MPKILKEILTGYFRLEHSGDLYFNFVNFWLKDAYILYAIINFNTVSVLVMDVKVFFLNLVFVSLNFTYTRTATGSDGTLPH